MNNLLSTVIYLGVGCLYQATYDDVNIRQLSDAPLSTFGHIFAWPLMILYHLIGLAGWVVVAIIAAVVLSVVIVWMADRAKSWYPKRKVG